MEPITIVDNGVLKNIYSLYFTFHQLISFNLKKVENKPTCQIYLRNSS